MTAFEPVPCRHPAPEDTETWAVEVASAIEALDQDLIEVTLEDGTRLEAEDGAEAVVLLAVRSRACDLGIEDIEESCSELVAIEEEAGVAADTPDDDLQLVTFRYMVAHTVLGVTEDLPDPALLEAVVSAAAKLIGEA